MINKCHKGHWVIIERVVSTVPLGVQGLCPTPISAVLKWPKGPLLADSTEESRSEPEFEPKIHMEAEAKPEPEFDGLKAATSGLALLVVDQVELNVDYQNDFGLLGLPELCQRCWQLLL